MARRAKTESQIAELAVLLGAVLVRHPRLAEAVLADSAGETKLENLAVTAVVESVPFAAGTGAAGRVLDRFGADHVAVAWCRHVAIDPDSTQAWDRWAYALADDLAIDDAERGWKLVLALVRTAVDDETLGMVAAGPLEQYVRAHAHTAIDRIELQAATDGWFRQALGGVWVWQALPSTLFERVATAAGSSLDRPVSIDAASTARAEYRRLDELRAITHDNSSSAKTRRAAMTEILRLLGIDEHDGD